MKKNIKSIIVILVLGLIFVPTVAFANATCPLGEKVTGDIAGALKIFRILAPLLTIGYSIYEGIKALVNGNIDAESKKIYTRFIKRVVYAVLLFVIPVLVDVLMQAMDVWDAQGHCQIDSEVRDVETGYESCMKNCSKIGDVSGRQICEEKCKNTNGENGGLNYTPTVEVDDLPTSAVVIQVDPTNIAKTVDSQPGNNNKQVDAQSGNNNKNVNAEYMNGNGNIVNTQNGNNSNNVVINDNGNSQNNVDIR